MVRSLIQVLFTRIQGQKNVTTAFVKAFAIKHDSLSLILETRSAEGGN